MTSAATYAPSRSPSSISSSEIFAFWISFRTLGSDLAAGMRDFLAALLDGVRELEAYQVGRALDSGFEGPVQFLVLHRDAVDGVERAEDVLVGAQAESAQEDRSQELALAVDADVEDVLLVVLKLDPRSAVRNDLAEEVGAVVGGLEEDAGERCNWLTMTRSVPLTMNVPFCVIRGTSPKKTSCSLMSRMVRLFGLRVLVEDGEAHGDLQRS